MFVFCQVLHLVALGLAQTLSSSSAITSISLSSVSQQSSTIPSSPVSSTQSSNSDSTSADPSNSTQIPGSNDTSIDNVNAQWSIFSPELSLPQPEVVFHAPTFEFTDPLGDDLTVSGLRPLVMAYYCGWLVDTLPPEKIDYSRYDIIDYAFVILDANYNLDFAGMDSDVLKRLVTCAHQHGTKVKVSIGGWTGSAHFSSAVSDAKNRLQVVQNIVDLYRRFNLDGIDIDWEYPGRQANPGNEVNRADSANYLEFLRLLRSALPSKAKITAAATPVTFAGLDGEPMDDVSAFAKVLDWVLIMNYDTWGTTSNPGPNAPLYDACKNSTQPASSAAAGFNAWTKAGFPARQLVLGLPSYGYISRTSTTHLRSRAKQTSLTFRQESGLDQSPSELTDVGAAASRTNIQLKSDDDNKDQGTISLRSMLKQGALAITKDKKEVIGAGGFTVYWDDCSGTPYLRSSGAKQVVPFDTARSIGMKASFVRQTEMRGVNFWDLQGDMVGSVLVNAARKALGRSI
ncbi:hypothetical protein PM082_005589 [Marasmius tenuissimus]|nr:hypothetical protein PM082_005589 [Marasmius tenuissimus]